MQGLKKKKNVYQGGKGVAVGFGGRKGEEYRGHYQKFNRDLGGYQGL